MSIRYFFWVCFWAEVSACSARNVATARSIVNGVRFRANVRREDRACRTLGGRNDRSGPEFETGGRTSPSKTASVAARLWNLMRESRGKHHMLGFAETTGQAEEDKILGGWQVAGISGLGIPHHPAKTIR